MDRMAYFLETLASPWEYRPLCHTYEPMRQGSLGKWDRTGAFGGIMKCVAARRIYGRLIRSVVGVVVNTTPAFTSA